MQDYECTDEELDWYRQALELACYFTPKAGLRLQLLTRERARCRPSVQTMMDANDPMHHHQHPIQQQQQQQQHQPQYSPYMFSTDGRVEDQPWGYQNQGHLTQQGGFEGVPELTRMFNGESRIGGDEMSWLDLTLAGNYTTGEGENEDDWLNSSR